MINSNNNYDNYIINTDSILINKINFFEAKTKKLIVLNEMHEDVFKNILEYIFKNKFNFSDLDKVYIKTQKTIKKFNNIEYSDFDFNLTSLNYLLYNITLKKTQDKLLQQTCIQNLDIKQ